MSADTLTTDIGYSVIDPLTGLKVIESFILHGVPGNNSLSVDELELSDTAVVGSIALDVNSSIFYKKVESGTGETKWVFLEDNSMVPTKRVDFITDDLFYRGFAVPGTLESDAKWRIERVQIELDGDSASIWADGNVLFDNVWDDRLSLAYS